MSVICLLLALVALLCALVVRAGGSGRLSRAEIAAFVCLPLMAFVTPLALGRPPEQLACRRIETQLQTTAECWSRYHQTEPVDKDPLAPFRSAGCRDSTAELIARGMSVPQITAVGIWLKEQQQRSVQEGWLSITGTHLCSHALNRGWIQMDELFAAYLARCRAALLSAAAMLALGLLWVFRRRGGGSSGGGGSSHPLDKPEAPSNSETPDSQGASSKDSGVRGKWVLRDGEWTDIN